MSQDRRKRIPSGTLTAYERWELPLLDENGNEVVEEEIEEVKPLTAADLEAIRKEAWDDGHQEGRAAGIEAGHAEGREQGFREGHEAGLAEGRASGHEEALSQTRGEVEAKLANLESLLGELLLPIQRHEDELETALVNVTTVLARAVVFRELSIDSSHIAIVVRQALAALPSTRDNVRLSVNPVDAEWVHQVADDFEADTSIIEDPTILAGGCKVETRHSLVDFTVEKRFQKAVQNMLNQQLASEEPGDSAELSDMMGDLSDYHGDVLADPGQQEAPDDDQSG